ncbi:membrane protein [Patulibacter americanus]|uniref:membrane protein n=1 Tax=Patulibacter americanus TaxID=588672 RepID=UPI0003B583BF|nr:membrane protein [Patulibacter americanus]
MSVDRRELDEATPHAQLYLDRLRSAHLALSGVTVLAFGGLVGALPLVALALPSLEEHTILGVPLAVLLMLAPYPVFVLIAWIYVRRADGLDETFVALVAEDDPDEPLRFGGIGGANGAPWRPTGTLGAGGPGVGGPGAVGRDAGGRPETDGPPGPGAA